MNSVVQQQYWDGVYARQPLKYNPKLVPFKDLFRKHLPRGGTCFEIGCFPGHFLVFFGQELQMEVSGLDATPAVGELAAHMQNHGVRYGQFIHEDFFSYVPETRYDVVCSFGFVEHFKNFEEVIRLHLRYLKPGGTLVISCPNFRKLQGLARRWFDAENLARHHTPAMDLDKWERILTDAGLEVVFRGYEGTFLFWRESKVDPIRRVCAGMLARTGNFVNPRINCPNSFTSPFMVMFARAPENWRG